jgi:hypothetical protein
LLVWYWDKFVIYAFGDTINLVTNLVYFYICCLHHTCDWKSVLWFFSSQEWTRDLSLFWCVQNDCGPHYICLAVGTGFCFLCIQWLGCESDHSSPSSKSLHCHHMSLMNFVVSPPSCGQSVTDFWGWDAYEAQLCCPDEVDGDIWIWSTRRDLKPKLY